MVAHVISPDYYVPFEGLTQEQIVDLIPLSQSTLKTQTFIGVLVKVQRLVLDAEHLEVLNKIFELETLSYAQYKLRQVLEN